MFLFKVRFTALFKDCVLYNSLAHVKLLQKESPNSVQNIFTVTHEWYCYINTAIYSGSPFMSVFTSLFELDSEQSFQSGYNDLVCGR